MKRSLNAASIHHAKARATPYKLSDGGGLYLLVTHAGARLWRYKYRLHGKEKTYGLGAYPALSLEQARQEHLRARELVSHGLNPAQERRAHRRAQAVEEANSFEAVAKRWMLSMSSSWSPGYAKQVATTLQRDVFPKIGKRKIKTVTAADLRPILEAVSSRRLRPNSSRTPDQGAATVALLIRQWSSQIFCYAIAHGLADHDNAHALRQVVARPKVKHHRHLVGSELPEFYEKLKSFSGTRQVGIAIELLMLTFVRTGELRGAEWSEVDLPNRIWRIPASRMKMGREHLVPLSDAAVQLIAELMELTGGSKFLFPNQRRPNAVMTMTTINRALERLGYAGRISGHGFRGTASTLLHERAYPAHLIEKQLAHDSKNKIAASYNHAEYLAERTKMMQEWADIARFGNGNIVSIRGTGKKPLQSAAA